MRVQSDSIWFGDNGRERQCERRGRGREVEQKKKNFGLDIRLHFFCSYPSTQTALYRSLSTARATLLSSCSSLHLSAKDMPLPGAAATGRAVAAVSSSRASGCLSSALSSAPSLAPIRSPLLRSSFDASSSSASSTRVAAFSSRSQEQQGSVPRVVAAKAVAEAPAAAPSSSSTTPLPSSVPIPNKDDPARAPRVLIAGGGIGGE